MYGVGGADDVSDDEELMLVSLTDFNEEEEEEEDEEEEAKDVNSGCTVLKKCLKEKSDDNKTNSNVSFDNNNDDLNKSNMLNDLNDTNSNDSGYMINFNNNDSFYVNDDDNDMVPSVYPFIPSVPTITEEEDEDGEECKSKFTSNDEDMKENHGLTLPLKTRVVSNPREAWKRAFHMIKCLKDPWEKFHITDHVSEFAIRHRFHALRRQWVTDRVEVKMEDMPFDQGAMRSCYRIKKLPSMAGKHKDWKHAHNYVAKQYLNNHVTRDVYFSDVLLQMNAKLWGEEYSRHNPPKKVDIVQMCVLEFPNRPADRRLFHLEHYIEGHYTKYNSNSGFVEESLRLTPQAFSHFTFERSGHQLIVVDIQGVGDLWTDPQIHSTEDIFGEGNLACKGMALFFHSHQCNSICHSLGLTPFDLASNELEDIVKAKASKRVVGAETVVRRKHCESIDSMERSELMHFLETRRGSTTSESDDDGYVEDSSPMGYAGGAAMGGDTTNNHNNNAFCPNPFHHFNNNQPHNYQHKHLSEHNCDEHPRPSRRERQRFYSECEDSVSLNNAEEEYRRQFEMESTQKHRPACVQQELLRRHLQATRKLSDSVLGQVHHELAKYHEMGRFVDSNEEGDLQAALFHERIAAELGVKEAMLTMASIYFDLSRELLVNVSVQRTAETTSKGEEYLLLAAGAGDWGAMLYLARAYETGEGLSQECKSASKAVEWYAGALEMQSEDEVGEFDPLVDTPSHAILATMAQLYSSGDSDLPVDPLYAAELYNRAAEEATKALKGRMAIKYYALAEEVAALEV